MQNYGVPPRRGEFYKKRGFTFIELAVVIAIFAILTTTAVVGLRYFQFSTTLNGEANKMVSAIKLARNKAMASENNQNYGLYFDLTGKYVLFSGDSYATTSADNIIYNLAPQIEFDSVNLNGGQTVIFNHVSGATEQTGAITIKLTSNPSEFQTILINASGQAYLADSGIFSLPSKRDSRHTHFLYNFNIKNAALLRLSFPDDNFNYDINFQDYLNAVKDAFYWQGTIAVGGQAQTLEIKTHSLTDISAQFSIQRDQRYNNKTAQIFIDGDNLINYSVNGSTTKGTSIFVSEPEWQ